MNDLSDPLSIGLIVAGLAVLYALVSAANVALRRATRDPIHALLSNDERFERAVQHLTRSDATLQGALSVSRLALTIGIVVAMSATVEAIGVGRFALITLTVLFVAEFLPYRLARRTSPSAVVFSVRVARVAYFALFPITWTVARWTSRPTVERETKEPESTAVDQTAAPSEPDEEPPTWTTDRAINGEERAMIHRILELPDTVVGEIMVPRTDMTCLEVSTPFPTALELIRESRFSRIPVYADSIDNMIGVLHLKDLLPYWNESTVRLEDLIQTSPLVVPESKKVNELFREFRFRRQHLAIVLDEYGGTAGMATMEDVLEEIVGEIQDEFDADESDSLMLEDGSFLVDGGIDLEDLNRQTGIDLPDDEMNTLNGFLVDLVGRVPKSGDIISYESIAEFEIVDADTRRVRRARVRQLTEPSKEQAGVDAPQ
ncbi:MAG: hemolysin family protein [Candidatus Poribacteria bacterium]|nr:hemolysin family protein [Candidatus Poribacteria bacterium]